MTIFERIIAREIPADIVYEDEHTLAFRDINPAAPTHVLIIPKRPIVNIAAASDSDLEVLGRLLLAAREVARVEGVSESGFRLVANSGPDSGQEVMHLHFHLVAGRALGWPPG